MDDGQLISLAVTCCGLHAEVSLFLDELHDASTTMMLVEASCGFVTASLALLFWHYDSDTCDNW